jgi:hypothetical protein
MAALLPKIQQFVELKNGTTIGIHVVLLVSASDTLAVPKLAQRVTASASSATLRTANANTVTVTDNASTADTTASGGNTVTLVGTAGQEVTIVTVHGPNVSNYGLEV